MIHELEDMIAEFQSAVEWGDFKAAYALSAQIEWLKMRETIARLGQLSFSEARDAFPQASVENSAWGQRWLVINGDDYTPNLNDRGYVSGWYKDNRGK